jgi:hypothetical protein
MKAVWAGAMIQLAIGASVAPVVHVGAFVFRLFKIPRSGVARNADAYGRKSMPYIGGKRQRGQATRFDG